MKRTARHLCLFAVISLLFSVIWHVPASAAVAPSIVPLGRINEGLLTPGRLDVDEAGNLYVADSRAGAVVKFDKYGQLIGRFTGAPVSGHGIAVTPDGSRVYVAGGNVVSILDGSTGDLVGRLGAGVGEFGLTGEIDLDGGGYIFAADAGKTIVRVYNPDGTFKSQFGGLGTTAGKFLTIWAMAVNVQRGEVYVADAAYSGRILTPRIQVFNLAGTTVLRTLYAETSFCPPPPAAPVPLAFFGSMTFDPAGRGYFLDSMTSEIRIMGLPSTYLSAYVESGYEVGQLMSPNDAAFDPLTNRLFVVGEGSKVEVFGIDGGQNPIIVRTNSKPEVPVSLSPVAGSEVASPNPVLLYQNAVDPDGDALTYEAKVFKGEALVAEYSGLAQGNENSSVQVATALEENSLYQWSVQAFDGKAVSGWSSLQSFYVNAVQEAPSVPVLNGPAGGAMIDGEGVLSWQASVDPDPFDVVEYRIELSADPSFAAEVIAQPATGTTLALSALVDYPLLEDGTTYFWRVKSVDNHGLVSEPSEAGDFVYDTTLLKVTANVPGAKVYIGGNHGYPGSYVGEVPVELRDFPVGPCSVVVERSGFEPVVAQVWPAYRENSVVYAEMIPAIAPADIKARPLQAGGVDILLSGDAAPFVIDYDNDGVKDLLVGDAAGQVTLYKGVLSTDGIFSYSAGTTLELSRLVPGASPFVVDWNNDGRKDLLVGAGDGSVLLFSNVGTEAAPVFGPGAYVSVSGEPLAVGASAVPLVADLDGDGDKDLLVGSAAGAVLSFRNEGSDSAPSLVPSGALVRTSSPVAPFFTDWDADGVREMIVAASEHLYLYNRQADGSYKAVGVLSVGSDLVGSRGNSSAGAFSLGDRLRVFALDFDGKKGKDLVVGNAAGAVRLARSNGTECVAAFSSALIEKVSQIDQMLSVNTLVAPSAVANANLLADAEAAIKAGDFKTAAKKMAVFEGLVPVGTELAFAVGELVKLLQ